MYKVYPEDFSTINEKCEVTFADCPEEKFTVIARGKFCGSPCLICDEDPVDGFMEDPNNFIIDKIFDKKSYNKNRDNLYAIIMPVMVE